MEKSNLPLPLKKRSSVEEEETVSGIRDDGGSSKLDKRVTTSTTPSKKHCLIRDSSGRVLKERSQFSGGGGGYLKKRFGYGSKKSGAPFSLKGSKAVVTSWCIAGDFADACFPALSEDADISVAESLRVKRGALSMKSKLLQLQERNKLILAKHQYPRTSPAHRAPHVTPDLRTSSILMTPLTLKIETSDDEGDKTQHEEQTRLLGESSSTSPIYHELDPIDGPASLDQHTYQSISEVREEMARLQARMNLGSTGTMSACGERNPGKNCLNVSGLSVRESSENRSHESGSAAQESAERKQNRVKRSIFSKFWISRRNLQEDATMGDGKAVLTSMTSLADDVITPTQAGIGLWNHPSSLGQDSLAQSPALLRSSNSRKQTPLNPTTAISGWNSYRSHPSMAKDFHSSDSGQEFYMPTDSSGYSNARCSCSNRLGAGNSYDCHYYGWRSDDEIESDGKVVPESQRTLQSFAKRSTIKAGTKSKSKALEEYLSSIELANALTEYHWNIYQTGNVNRKESEATLNSSRRADEFLEARSTDTNALIAFHQSQTVTNPFMSVQIAPNEENANTGLDTSDIYTQNIDPALFLSRQAALSPSSFFRGKTPRSQLFSSPSCGVRMAEMRAVRRKSESALLSESSSPETLPRSPVASRHSSSAPEETGEVSPCLKRTEPNQGSRGSMDTILEEDQSMENATMLAILSRGPGTERSIAGLSRHSDSSQMTPSPSESDSLNTIPEYRIPEEALSSDGSVNIHEENSGHRTQGALRSKQTTDSKKNGSRLKTPRPVKHRTPSGHTKPTNNTGDCIPPLDSSSQQYRSSAEARKTDNPTPNASPLLFDCNSTTEQEQKPLIRHAVIRQIESASSPQEGGLELPRETPRFSYQPTTRLKTGSGIPRTTKSSCTNRTHSADENPARNRREDEASKKRFDCQNQRKHLNEKSQKEGAGLPIISRSYSQDVTFAEKRGKHFDCRHSDNSTSSGEMSNRRESTRNWADLGQTPEITVDRSLNRNTEFQNPSEYHVSEISSLSSSLTSSNSNSSVFGVTESESSDSPTSASTRDFDLEPESPSSSSTAAGNRRPDAQSSSSSQTNPAEEDSVTNDATESTATTKPQPRRKGKSQLPAPRTDATQCLERLERLRVETKQTKNESHQKLRH